MAKISPHFLGLFVEVICTSFLPLFGRSLCSSSSFHSSFPFSLPLAAEVETPYLTVSSPFFRPPLFFPPPHCLFPLSPSLCALGGRSYSASEGRKESAAAAARVPQVAVISSFSPPVWPLV